MNSTVNCGTVVTISDKETVRKQKRKLSFYGNIYVVKDPANPQNEGGVFLYKFGKKIFDKIMEICNLSLKTKLPSILLISKG